MPSRLGKTGIEATAKKPGVVYFLWLSLNIYSWMLYKDRRLFILKEECSRSDGTVGNVSGEGLKADGTRQGAEEITLCGKKPETRAGSPSLTTVFSLKNYLTLQNQHQVF